MPECLFDWRNKVLFKLPCCLSNEGDAKCFIDEIESFTNGKLKLIVLWSTRNIKSLFPLKDLNICLELSMNVNVRVVNGILVKLLETVVFASINMKAQQVNQNLPNTLLITKHICLRGKF